MFFQQSERTSSDRGIAQLVEHRSPKPSAEGSNPSAPATVIDSLAVFDNKDGAVVQLVRTPACHAGGRGFKSLPRRHLLGAIAPDMLL